MSSLPSSDGVKKLRELIHKHKEWNKQLLDARAVAAKIEYLSEEVRTIHSEVLKTLESMDCKSDGNAGWERRIMWMLTELITQESTDKQSS